MGKFGLWAAMEGPEVLIWMGEERGSWILGVLFAGEVVGVMNGVFLVLGGSGVEVLGPIDDGGVSAGSQDGVCTVDSCPWSSGDSGGCMSGVWLCVWLCVVAIGVRLPGWSVLGRVYTGTLGMRGRIGGCVCVCMVRGGVGRRPGFLLG